VARIQPIAVLASVEQSCKGYSARSTGNITD